MVDAVEGIIGMEWIEGHTVRSLLGAGEEIDSDSNEYDDGDIGEDDLEKVDDPLALYALTQGMQLCDWIPVCPRTKRTCIHRAPNEYDWI